MLLLLVFGEYGVFEGDLSGGEWLGGVVDVCWVNGVGELMLFKKFERGDWFVKLVYCVLLYY